MGNMELFTNDSEFAEGMDSSVNLMSEISDEVVQNSYGSTFINVCRIVRKKASEKKIVVEQNAHKSNDGRNIHLFKLIEACNLSVNDFVNEYLSVLQPYSLEKSF